MKFLSVAQVAKNWNLSERTVRNYWRKRKNSRCLFNRQNMEYSRKCRTSEKEQLSKTSAE